MKQPKSSTNAQVPGKPLNPQQFPLHAQTDATAGRDKVRELVPVHAVAELLGRVAPSPETSATDALWYVWADRGS